MRRCPSLLLRLLLTLGLLAQAPLAPAAPLRTLRIVGTVFPRIYEQTGSEKTPTGLGVDLLRQAAGRLGLTLNFEFYPWARALSMVEQGRADVLVGPYRNAEREQRFAFTQQAFFEDTLVFYARRDRQPPLWQGSYAGLQGHAIAQVQGWAYGEAFEKAATELRASRVRDVATGLLMLERGRIELLASSERDTEPVLQQLGLIERLQASGPPLAQLRAYFACPRHPRGQADCAALDRVIGELRTQGELRELGRRWKVKIPD